MLCCLYSLPKIISCFENGCRLACDALGVPKKAPCCGGTGSSFLLLAIIYSYVFFWAAQWGSPGFQRTHLLRHSSPSLLSPLSELLRRIALIFLWSLLPRLPFLSPSFFPDSSSVPLFRQIGRLFSISTNRCDKKGQFCYPPWEGPFGAHIRTQTDKRVMGTDAFDRACLVQNGKASSRRECRGYF